MTLTQLRYLCEIVRQGLHLSHAAEALHTSQPGVSKQIQLLEQELGCLIFKRRRNRLLDLTPTGRDIHHYARQALLEIENIRSVSSKSEQGAGGKLFIASAMNQVRYVLPTIIGRYIKKYPNTRLEFFQGNRHQVFARVESGEADLAIGVDPGVSDGNVAMLRYGTLQHSIVAKLGHPLLRSAKPTLQEIVQYPIITYMFEPDGRWKFDHVFKAKGLTPNIVFRAADADVSKAYVQLGIGVTVLTNISFDKKRDSQLRAINADYLFPPEPLFIGFNRKRYMPGHLVDLIKMVAPTLTTKDIEQARLGL